MRSATEAIARGCFRSQLVSTLSEAATRDAAALAVAASSVPAAACSSGHGAWNGVPPGCGSSHVLPRHLGPPTSPPKSAQRPSYSAAGSCRTAALRSWTAAGGTAAARSPVAAAAGPSYAGGGAFRGFAASAAGPRRGGGGGGGGNVGNDGGGGQEAVAEVVAAEEAARMVLSDPMSRLMASQGMPVGLSLGRGGREGTVPTASAAAAAAGSRVDPQRPPSSPAPGAGEEEGEEDLSRPPPAEPSYQMEAFSDMLRATAAAARRGGAAGGGAGGGVGGGDGGGGGGYIAGVQAVGPSLEDSWGTTRESPADIARRIVESNLEAARGPRSGGAAHPQEGPSLPEDEDGEDEGSPDSDPALSLSPSEQKYASLEAMSADIKRLDEVFELLASVPWLDEDVLSEKELKGVARVGLLGTLEEVGFNIRHQLLHIWSGERGADLAAGPGLQFRDQAALLAILYHTQQIEDRHGPPPGGYLPPPPQ